MIKYRTMNRIELAAEFGISRSKLYRDIRKLDIEFQKKIKGELLFEEDVKYIHENIIIQKNYKTGSK